MPWQTVGASTQTWTGQTATSQGWQSSALTLDVCSVNSRPSRLYPILDSTGDQVDFVYRIRDDDPWYLPGSPLNPSVVITSSGITAP